MVTKKLSGVYTTIDTSGFVPTPSINYGGAIGIIGTYEADNMYGSGSLAAGDLWTSATDGHVIEIDGNNEFIDYLGSMISGSLDVVSGSATSGSVISDWSPSPSGIIDGDGLAVGGYDPENSLFRAIQLIRMYNSDVKIYFCAIDGSTNGGASAEAVLTTAETNALAALKEYNDIGFINIAGRIPLATVQTHVETCRNDTYKSPRLYVTGLGYEHMLSGSTVDLSDYTTLKDNLGHTVVYAGNSSIGFDVYEGTYGTVKEYIHMGGHWLSHIITAIMASQTEKTTLLRQFSPFGASTKEYTKDAYYLYDTTSDPKAQVFDTSYKSFLTEGQMEDLFDEGVLFTRRIGSNYYFDIAATFSSNTSSFTNITTRRIVDRIRRGADTILNTYIAEPNSAVTHERAVGSVTRFLTALYEKGYIKSSFGVRVWASDQDQIDGIINCKIEITPILETKYIELTIAVTK